MAQTTVVVAVTLNRAIDDREREAFALRVVETLIDEFPEPEDARVAELFPGEDVAGLMGEAREWIEATMSYENASAGYDSPTGQSIVDRLRAAADAMGMEGSDGPRD